MMNRIKRNRQWLIARESLAVFIFVTVPFRLTIRAISLFLLGTVCVLIFASEPMKQGTLFIAMAVVSLLLATFELIRDCRTHCFASVNRNEFSKRMHLYLEQGGWSVRFNNQHEFYATKSIGRARCYFSTLFLKDRISVSAVYELPFPLSYFCSRKLLRAASDAATGDGLGDARASFPPA